MIDLEMARSNLLNRQFRHRDPRARLIQVYHTRDWPHQHTEEDASHVLHAGAQKGLMGYRNKTYVAFASEDIAKYRLMEAWRENDKIEFDFFDAHDLYISRDTSKPETIKRNLRERLKNAKQVILLGSTVAKQKGSDGVSFLAHEVEVGVEFKLPIVVVNLDQDRTVNRSHIPTSLLSANYYTMSVSYQPKIIMYALDNYAVEFSVSGNQGPYQYTPETYAKLGM